MRWQVVAYSIPDLGRTLCRYDRVFSTAQSHSATPLSRELIGRLECCSDDTIAKLTRLGGVISTYIGKTTNGRSIELPLHTFTGQGSNIEVDFPSIIPSVPSPSALLNLTRIRCLVSTPRHGHAQSLHQWAIHHKELSSRGRLATTFRASRSFPNIWSMGHLLSVRSSGQRFPARCRRKGKCTQGTKHWR